MTNSCFARHSVSPWWSWRTKQFANHWSANLQAWYFELIRQNLKLTRLRQTLLLNYVWLSFEYYSEQWYLSKALASWPGWETSLRIGYLHMSGFLSSEFYLSIRQVYVQMCRLSSGNCRWSIIQHGIWRCSGSPSGNSWAPLPELRSQTSRTSIVNCLRTSRNRAWVLCSIPNNWGRTGSWQPEWLPNGALQRAYHACYSVWRYVSLLRKNWWHSASFELNG